LAAHRLLGVHALCRPYYIRQCEMSGVDRRAPRQAGVRSGHSTERAPSGARWRWLQDAAQCSIVTALLHVSDHVNPCSSQHADIPRDKVMPI